MPASNVPGWQLGYRFNAANYSGGQFVDLTGNGNPMVVQNGSPVFETVDGNDGVKLDNTWNARFWPPNAWQGTVVLALRVAPQVTATLTKYLIDYRGSGTGQQGRLVNVVFSGQLRFQLVGITANSTVPITMGTAGVGTGVSGVTAFCLDQERRNTYATLDGVTIATGTVDTGTIDGNAFAMGSSVVGAHLGALAGDVSNTTADTDVDIHMFELHFFEANPIQDAATELQAFMAELAASYA